MTRTDKIEAFLQHAGWAGATRHPLAGDASHRRYLRLAAPGGARAVLMDAPPGIGGHVNPFLSIARHLRALGFSAPEIFAADTAQGLVLLEDLGDALFVRVVAGTPDAEPELYGAATDLLAELAAHPLPKGAPAYDAATMADRARLAALWYRPGREGRIPAPAGPAHEDADAAGALAAATHTAIAAHAPGRCLALRDYHAENLIWLPRRTGLARVGLLDFQDAAAAPPGYDLISLVEDARRDVLLPIRDAMLARYARATGTDPEALAAACAALGAQRSLRILGVFARLSLRDGKPAYADLMPRVWALLQRDLAHPALAELRGAVADYLGPPTDAARASLRAASGTVADPAPAEP